MEDNVQFILASASPRRQQLLAQAGYHFIVLPSDVDETVFSAEGKSTARYAEELALAKARAVAKAYPEMLVMGADTVVDFEGEIIGKPNDAAHAEQITRRLFSAPHEVITGLALVRLKDGFERVESDITVVHPRKLTDQQILAHIEAGDWQGKAGAYGIQEKGDEFVERIEGSFTNVMGLPMELVARMLAGAN